MPIIASIWCSCTGMVGLSSNSCWHHCPSASGFDDSARAWSHLRRVDANPPVEDSVTTRDLHGTNWSGIGSRGLTQMWSICPLPAALKKCPHSQRHTHQPLKLSTSVYEAAQERTVIPQHILKAYRWPTEVFRFQHWGRRRKELLHSHMFQPKPHCVTVENPVRDDLSKHHVNTAASEPYSFAAGYAISHSVQACHRACSLHI